MYFVLVLSLDYDAWKMLPSYPLFCSILLFLQLLLGAPLWSPSPESRRPLSHSHLADSSASWRPSGTSHMKLLTTGFSTTYRSLFLQEVIFLYECWFFYQMISSVKILGLHVYGSSLTSFLNHCCNKILYWYKSIVIITVAGYCHYFKYVADFYLE